jgi:hypothetical protein
VKRFLRRQAPSAPRASIRVEVAPGEEAQVDFGYAGQFLDPELGRVRRAWVFVMVLSCSRHQYAELVFDQAVATWLRLHRAAFEFFGGIPRRVVLDNLRAAIVHAALHDPEVQRSYREFAEHYGFLIAPCRPRTPEHKGKVEQGGVHYVKRNALAGRTFRDLHDGNRHAQDGRVVPGGVRDEVMHRLMAGAHVARIDARRHRFDALPVPRQTQPGDIVPEGTMPISVTEGGRELLNIRLKPLGAGAREVVPRVPAYLMNSLAF